MEAERSASTTTDTRNSYSFLQLAQTLLRWNHPIPGKKLTTKVEGCKGGSGGDGRLAPGAAHGAMRWRKTERQCQARTRHEGPGTTDLLHAVYLPTATGTTTFGWVTTRVQRRGANHTLRTAVSVSYL